MSDAIRVGDGFCAFAALCSAILNAYQHNGPATAWFLCACVALGRLASRPE